jgi:hypothetical protein
MTGLTFTPRCTNLAERYDLVRTFLNASPAAWQALVAAGQCR